MDDLIRPSQSQPSEGAKQTPSLLNYEYRSVTTTRWGTKVEKIFRGNEKHQEVIIKTRDIFQRFLNWLELSIVPKDYFSNTKLVISENNKASTPNQLKEIVHSHVSEVCNEVLHIGNVKTTNEVYVQEMVKKQIDKAVKSLQETIDSAYSSVAQEHYSNAFWDIQTRSGNAADAINAAKQLDKGRGIDQFDENGRTKLYEAVSKLDILAIQRLLKDGANPDLASHTIDKLTPKKLFQEMRKKLGSALRDHENVVQIAKWLGLK